MQSTVDRVVQAVAVPWQWHSVVFLGKTLHFQIRSLHLIEQMCTHTVTARFPVLRYLVSSIRRGRPLRIETTRATEFKPQFILVYCILTVFSISTAFLAVFYQGLPVYCFYGTASFLTAPCGNGFTVFVKCSRITAYSRTSEINVEIHAKLFMVYGLSPLSSTV